VTLLHGALLTPLRSAGRTADPQRTQTDGDDDEAALIDAASVHVRRQSHARQHDDDAIGRVQCSADAISGISKSVRLFEEHFAVELSSRREMLG
jgi:hypothetical protein